MATTIRSSSTIPTLRTSGTKKGCAVHSSGQVIAAFPSTSTAITVYDTTSADRSAWTLRATLTVTALYTNPSPNFAVVMGHDQTYIYVAYRCSDTSIRGRKVTIAGWAAGAEETIQAAVAGLGFTGFDISVSEGGAIAAAILYEGTTTSHGYRTRIRTTAGAWVAGDSIQTGSGTLKSGMADISCSFIKGGTATNRRFVIVRSYGTTAAQSMPTLVNVSINETTGATNSNPDANDVDANVAIELAFGALANYTSTTYTFPPVRTFLFMTPTTGRVYLAMLYDGDSGNTGIMCAVVQINATLGGGADGFADTFAISGSTQLFTKTSPQVQAHSVVTFAYDEVSKPTFNFTAYGLTNAQGLLTYIAKLDSEVAPIAPTWIANNGQWGGSGVTHVPEAIFGNHSIPTAAAYSKKHDVIGFTAGSPNNVVASYWTGLPDITGLKPTTGEVVADSTPMLTGIVAVPQWLIIPPKFRLSWEAATDAAFTLNYKTYVDPTVFQHGAYSSGAKTSALSDWKGLALASGTWYLRGKVTDLYGNTDIFTGGQFTVTHPAYSASVTPPYTSLQAYAYLDPGAVNGYSTVPVAWTFVDAWAEDSQTAYQLIVRDEVTATNVWDSGKIFSVAKNALARVPFASKGHACTVTVLLWDSFDQSAAATQPTQTGRFVTYDAATITGFAATSIDGSGFVNTNDPVFSYSYTLGPVSVVTRLELVITKGGQTVFAGTLNSPALTGSITAVGAALLNNTAYTATLTAVDNNGMTVSTSINFTTLWTPPATAGDLAVALTDYNVENKGYVTVTWGTAAQETEFVGWNVYRKVDMLDALGNVISQGTEEWIGFDGTTSAHSFKDFFAPSGHRVGYLVRQVVRRFGAPVEGTNTTWTYVLPVTDGYWLIDPDQIDPTASAFKLYNVTADAYTIKYEEAAIQIIGRGLHIDRGDRLGVDGSLTCQLRDSTGTSARQKKLRLEEIKEEARSLFLRTPFGDKWYVNIGDMTVTRIAGTGNAEFVDVTVPYVEVYQ